MFLSSKSYIDCKSTTVHLLIANVAVDVSITFNSCKSHVTAIIFHIELQHLPECVNRTNNRKQNLIMAYLTKVTHVSIESPSPHLHNT